MKKLPLLALLMTFFLFGNAQEEIKNNALFLGGSLSFSSNSDSYPTTLFPIIPPIGSISSTIDVKNSSVSFFPYFGKELNSNWSAGLLLDFRVSNYSSINLLPLNSAERNSLEMGFGLFTRYIINPANAFHFYLQPYVQYNFRNDKSREENSLNMVVNRESETNYLDVGAGAGILYNINKRWRATLAFGGIQYINGTSQDVETEETNKFNSFNTNLGLSSLRLGFELKL